MKQVKHQLIIALFLASTALPLIVVHGAGGRIEGKVTDPKGAVIVGATVTVTNPVTCPVER
jgi:hypothetical protein